MIIKTTNTITTHLCLKTRLKITACSLNIFLLARNGDGDRFVLADAAGNGGEIDISNVLEN